MAKIPTGEFAMMIFEGVFAQNVKMRRERKERREQRTLTRYICRGFGDLHLILMLSFIGVVRWMTLWYDFSLSPFGSISFVNCVYCVI